MMNKFMKTIALSMAMLCLGAGAAGAAQFSDAQSGKNLTAAQLASKLQKYDVVFFGEYHDQSEIHQYELELLEAMYKAKGAKLALSMEMFEVDNQSKLNNFLADTLSEENFLAASRPWPNYRTDYAPLVNFAKEKKMPVIAANVPRFLAAHVLMRIKMKEKGMSVLSMFAMMGGSKPRQAAVKGDYDLVQGVGAFLEQAGISVTHKMCAHSLKAITGPAADVEAYAEEGEWLQEIRELRNTLFFADDVALTQADASNTKVLISAPFMNGVVATHLPFMGEKGADFLLEQIQGYYQK